MKKHSYSIYRHIVVIVLIPFIILTLLLLGTYEVYRASMFGRSQEEFALQMEQYRLRLEERLNNIRNTAREVGYSEAVQKYFVQMNNAQRADNYIFCGTCSTHLSMRRQACAPFMWWMKAARFWIRGTIYCTIFSALAWSMILMDGQRAFSRIFCRKASMNRPAIACIARR